MRNSQILGTLLFSCTLFAITVQSTSLGSMSIEEYCNELNYPIESHNITTEDGYILTYHRIQRKNTTISNRTPKGVVYLQHGLLDSSFDFIVNTEHKAPGFILANQGFDVWMGNSRGNHFSLGHESLNWKTDPQYWNFSWQNISKYDLPAAFSYISKHTNVEKIDYIGHSQGTTIMFAALAEQNQVVLKHLGKFIALGPVAFVNHATLTGVNVIKSHNLVEVLKILKINYVMMPSEQGTQITQLICKVSPQLCGFFDKELANFEPKTDNLERFSVIVGHYPDSTSTRVLQHWEQMLKNPIQGDMRKFDYGNIFTNLKMYRQKSAPSYDLSKIQQHVYLVAGKYDRIADPADVEILNSKLFSSTLTFIEGGHGTFMWADDISYFYQYVLPIINSNEAY